MSLSATFSHKVIFIRQVLGSKSVFVVDFNDGAKIFDTCLVEIDCRLLLDECKFQTTAIHGKEEILHFLLRTIDMLEHCGVIGTERKFVLMVMLFEFRKNLHHLKEVVSVGEIEGQTVLQTCQIVSPSALV